MAINSIDSTYLNSITDISSAQTKSEQAKFEEILKRTSATAEKKDEDLKEACEAFESYYLNKVFGEMRKSIQKGDAAQASQGRDMYEDLLYDAYTKEMAKGTGTGLKEMLYKQLKNN